MLKLLHVVIEFGRRFAADIALERLEPGAARKSALSTSMASCGTRWAA
ncbi:hypothetical protein LP420_20505 [Massilia sp. B-10]|nr:hypothetical protein LP420_20505 [Massilia sp. B-10]